MSEGKRQPEPQFTLSPASCVASSGPLQVPEALSGPWRTQAPRWMQWPRSHPEQYQPRSRGAVQDWGASVCPQLTLSLSLAPESLAEPRNACYLQLVIEILVQVPR